MKEIILHHPTSVGSGLNSSIPDHAKNSTTYIPPETKINEEITPPLQEELVEKPKTWRRDKDERGRPIIVIVEESE